MSPAKDTPKDSPKDTVGAFVPHTPPRIAGSGKGPLQGLTFAVKDLYDIEAYPTGGGSPDWLRTHEPATETAIAVRSCLDAGADMIGKTVCDELFYSLTGANAHYGTPVNSRAPDRLPGGSSSGSAAAVAAGLCDFSLGSDTGGSVRVPAGMCGLFGLRPTHGRIDLTGGMAMAPSFDTAGWFAADADIFRKVGPVLLDDRAVPGTVNRILVADDAFNWADGEVSEPLRDFIDDAADTMPDTASAFAAPQGLDKGPEAFRVLQAWEVWQTFGDWVTETKPEFGPGIKERFAAAAEITDAEVAAARPEADAIRDQLRARVQPGTVLCLPTAAALPPKLDADEETLNHFRARTMALTCLAGLSGLPQVNIPAAISDDVPAGSGPVPVGLSFIGWAGGDEVLLDLAVLLAPRIGGA